LATTNTTSTVGVVGVIETFFLGFEVEERTFVCRFDRDWAVSARSQKLENADEAEDDHNCLESISVGGIKFNHL